MKINKKLHVKVGDKVKVIAGFGSLNSNKQSVIFNQNYKDLYLSGNIISSKSDGYRDNNNFIKCDCGKRCVSDMGICTKVFIADEHFGEILLQKNFLVEKF